MLRVGPPDRERDMPEEEEGKVFAGMVRARITVEGLKHHIETAFHEYTIDLEATARYELDQALKRFDLQAAIRAEIREELPRMIQRAVVKHIDAAVTEQIRRPEVEALLHNALLQYLKEHVK